MAWEMLTLVPPAILCSPEKFSERWHQALGMPVRSHYTLSYYRPLMLHHARGSVAVRAIVRKKASTKHTVNPPKSDSEEGIVGNKNSS